MPFLVPRLFPDLSIKNNRMLKETYPIAHKLVTIVESLIIIIIIIIIIKQ